MGVLRIGHAPNSNFDFFWGLTGKSLADIKVEVDGLAREEDWYRVLNSMEKD